MALHRLIDRWEELATTSGAGDFTLSGAAMPGRVTAASKLAVGDTTWYCAQNAAEWEIGVGTLSAPYTLTRTTVLSSSTGAKVSFSAPPMLFSALPATSLASFTSVKRSTAQSIPNGLHTPIIFDVEFDNTVSAWSSATPTRITPPASARFIRLSGSVVFAPNATGPRLLRFMKNGGPIDSTSIVTQTTTTAAIEWGLSTISRWMRVAAGDYFEMSVLQSSGAALNLSASAGQAPVFSAEFM